MGEEAIVKNADNLIRIVAPIDVANNAVIDTGVTVTAQFFDEKYDTPVLFKTYTLTKEYEEDGPQLATVDSAFGAEAGANVEFETDDVTNPLPVAQNGALDQTIILSGGDIADNTIEVSSAGVKASIGKKIFTNFSANDPLVLMVPKSQWDLWKALDDVIIQHRDGTQGPLDIVQERVAYRGEYFLVISGTGSLPVGPGATLKKPLLPDLTGFTLYGSPLINTTDWGFEAVLESDAASQDGMLVGMRVRIELFFNPAAADLDGRFTLSLPVVSGG